MAFQFYLLKLLEVYEADDVLKRMEYEEADEDKEADPAPSHHSKKLVEKIDAIQYEFNLVSNFPKDKIILKRMEDDSGIFIISDRLKGYVTPYLHPYVSLEILTKVLFGGSLDSKCEDILKTIVQDVQLDRRMQYSMELLSGLSSPGIESFNVPPFHIHCNNSVPRNRMAHDENKVLVQDYSCLEVKFSDGEIALVRVMAIVKLSSTVVPIQFSNAHGKSCSNGHNEVRLLVLKFTMVEGQTNRKRVRYSWNKKQDGRLEGLELHVIELKAVVRPACVIPQFLKSFSGIERETYKENSHQTYKAKRFDHIPVHSICNFDVSNTFAPENYIESESVEGEIDLNDALPTNLSDYQIEQIQSIILKRAGLEDGSHENRKVQADEEREDVYDDYA